MTVADAHAIAFQHHQAGRLAEAEVIYRQILSHYPNDAAALHRLGVLAHQVGKHDLAVDFISKAIAIDSNDAVFHFNLASALTAQGKLDQAIAAASRAIQLQPGYADAYLKLGNALTFQGNYVEAASAYTQLIQLKSDDVDAHCNLGYVLWKLGRLNEAVAACSRAIQINPNEAGGYNNLSNALSDMGRIDEAVASCLKVIELKPDYAEAYSNLGALRSDQGRLDEAVAAYSRAIQLKPEDPVAHNNLANALKDQGQLEEAVASNERAVALSPGDSRFHSNLLLAIHYHPRFTAATIFDEHRQWNQRHAESLKKFIPAHDNSPDTERRLKIGYVSPDFHSHPVGRFMAPILEQADHSQFEIFCYADVRHPDPMTDRLRGSADHWRNIAGLPDEQATRIIRDDRIDILVDLAMHTAGNRLLVFARKPAPVQVTWLAYCSTTGLDTIDYRLTDPYLEPPGLGNQCYSEQSIVLPETYWCYAPATATTDIEALPALTSGDVTFGCFNNFAKVSNDSLALWGRLLREAPQSRLLLYAKEGSHRRRVIDQLIAQDVDPGRATFVGFAPPPDYFRLYHRIDIALDPFPYAGGTTTCDALWMGVPVVSLAGKTAVGRAGVSILSNIGLPQLIAQSPDQYVSIAKELASDLSRLSVLRASLRDQMRQSPLMDAPRFTRNIHSAYRLIWRKWCESQSTV